MGSRSTSLTAAPAGGGILFTVETAAAGRTYPDVYINFVAFDAACNQLVVESGYGRVGITAASAGSVSGNFSVN